MYYHYMQSVVLDKLVPVQVSLPDEAYIELKRRATERGVTMSRIAREILGIDERAPRTKRQLRKTP